MKEKDIKSLEHTKYRCQYHIVFAPKYRRQIIYREIKADIGYILRELCNRKGIEIIEAEACPDHIHMLLSIPPKYSVSDVMGYLKGKSSLMIFDRHANLKYKFGRRTFWAKRILCGHSRAKQEGNPGIYQAPIGRGSVGGSDEHKRILRPIHRGKERSKEKVKTSAR